MLEANRRSAEKRCEPDDGEQSLPGDVGELLLPLTPVHALFEMYFIAFLLQCVNITIRLA
jgi:hypothetical protein